MRLPRAASLCASRNDNGQHMPPFQQQNIKLHVDEYPHVRVLLAYYIRVCAIYMRECVCSSVHYPYVAHFYCSTCCHTLSLLPPSSLCLGVCLCVCVNYLMVCKFAMRCVAAWFQFCGWRKINFVSGLILPLCCIASPVASCQLPVYNFICRRCTAPQSVYVICSYCAQLYRKQEAHTNLINLKCMKAVANQHNIMLTHTHT